MTHHLRSLGEVRQKEWWSIWLEGYWENRLLGVPAQLDDTEIETMLEWTALLPAVYPEAVDLAVRMRDVPLQRSMVIRWTGTSEMVQKQPNAVARLLIHLGKAGQQPWTWYDAAAIVDELLQSNLASEIENWPQGNRCQDRFAVGRIPALYQFGSTTGPDCRLRPAFPPVARVCPVVVLPRQRGGTRPWR